MKNISSHELSSYWELYFFYLVVTNLNFWKSFPLCSGGLSLEGPCAPSLALVSKPDMTSRIFPRLDTFKFECHLSALLLGSSRMRRKGRGFWGAGAMLRPMGRPRKRKKSKWHLLLNIDKIFSEISNLVLVICVRLIYWIRIQSKYFRREAI